MIDKRKRNIIAAISVLVVAANLYVILHHNPLDEPRLEILKKIISCGMLDLIYVCFLKFYDKIVILPVELYQNRKLIWKLSKNDFKMRFAGSYLGIFWAFVQPVVTVLVYWFVFEIGFNSKAQLLSAGIDLPFVLYLTSGMVPWFFFSEAWGAATGSLMEYSYLVKKVVFKISILPIIKIISALFVHLFFIAFALCVFAGFGFYPDVYTLQVFYFSFCLFIFVLGLSYTTCSLVIFFRDLSQIINIILQVGIWLTPIMWVMDTTPIPQQYKWLFKLNPINYIVEGYRMALVEKSWFFEHFFSTAYFWIVTFCVFAVGALVFKRLKVHFADVL